MTSKSNHFAGPPDVDPCPGVGDVKNELYVTRRSRLFARIESVRTWIAVVLFLIFLILGLLLGIEALRIHQLPVSAELAELASFCLLISGLAGIIPVAHPYFLQRIKRAKQRATIGNIPRYFTQESGHSEPDYKKLYEDYHKRETDKKGFFTAGLPVYLLVHPKEGRTFDAKVRTITDARLCESHKHEDSTFCNCALTIRAAELGLDWMGFRQSCEAEKQKSYYHFGNEVGLRLRGLENDKDPKEVLIDGGTCRWNDFFCTELAANLKINDQDNTFPNMRELFEGVSWSKGEIDLKDLKEAGTRYSMLIGTCTLVTTCDGYLVLARRSRHVTSDIGMVTSTANGGVRWRDVVNRWTFWGGSKPRSLQRAALRELREEIGIKKAKLKKDDTPFLGAGFDLVHGRDLNFYAHFESTLSFGKVSGTRGKARDSWETDYLIPVPLVSIDSGNGNLLSPFERFADGLDRQLRAALYCFAKSGRLKHLKERYSRSQS